MPFPTEPQTPQGPKKELVLKVMEARQKDVGRAKVRIDVEMLASIGVSPGEVVEIEGTRKTSAIAWANAAEDAGLDIIRMDGIIRKNAGVSIGDKVTVRKAVAKSGSFAKLAPSNFSITVDPGFVSYVKKKLKDMPLMEGDTVLIPVLGQAIPFTVVQVRPQGVIMITDETAITISEKPTEQSKLPRVTYEDIGGLKQVIEKVRELIELPLRHPELFKRLGIDPPKGVLLYGPPGVGKTLLAKAVANETDAYFTSINGPEIMSKFYGESEQRLREIFEDAKKHAPAIIFIDEIDAIAPKRDEVIGEVERRVVAQLLTLMDGLESRGNVMVVAATNRPSALDPALRRPGRFDRELEIPLPDKEGRLEILQIHTRNMPLAQDVDPMELSEVTHGYTGADLSALTREAAMYALRRYLPQIDLPQDKIPPEILETMQVSMDDFRKAFKEIVPSGLREIYVEVPEVKWDQVGGLEEVKTELREVVEWPLKFTDYYTKLGITPPRGILLFGPPGTGKTLLAKAVATESGSNFIAVRGPEVLSKWVGESEKAIRDIFRKARQYAPAVIFFDEIDAIVPMRGMTADSNVLERLVSQFLTEIDGVEKLENVAIIAATNRPDIIDPALLRPGRIEKLIYVPPPDKAGRIEILKVHTRGMRLDPSISLEEIADRTEGYTGADLAALVREAGLLAIKDAIQRSLPADQVVTSAEHFVNALKKVKPSVSQDMIQFYNSWYEKARQQVPKQVLKPSTFA